MKRYSTVRLFLIVFTCTFLLGSMFVALALQANAKRVVTLTDGDDVYHANKSQMGAHTILALAGADRVWGGVGSDLEKGGPGNDRLHGFQNGSDTLIGGGGWDICVVSSIGNDTARCEVVIAK